MQEEPSSYLDRRMSLVGEGKTTISLEESSSTQRKSPRYLLEGSLPNIKDTRRYSVKKNHKDYLSIPFGIMPSNYSWELLPPYPDDSSPSLKAKLQRRKSS